VAEPSRSFIVTARARRGESRSRHPATLARQQLDTFDASELRCLGRAPQPDRSVSNGVVGDAWWSLLRYVNPDVVYT